MDDIYFNNEGFILNISEEFSKKVADYQHTMYLDNMDNSNTEAFSLWIDKALQPAYELGMKTVLIGGEWEEADYCYQNYQGFAQSYL